MIAGAMVIARSDGDRWCDGDRTSQGATMAIATTRVLAMLIAGNLVAFVFVVVFVFLFRCCLCILLFVYFVFVFSFCCVWF